MTVFVDTSALYALLDRDDTQHQKAKSAFSGLLKKEELVTHSYVIVEAVALTQRRLGSDAVRALVDELLPAIGTTIWVDEAAHRASMSALLAASPTDVSLVDQVSFHVMRELGVSRAFAFDDDFRAAGFSTLP